jgi:3-methylfumaryl-CoA hydratase
MNAPFVNSRDDFAAAFQTWIGKSVTIDDEIALPSVRRIAAMLDIDPSGFKAGDAIPPHWYSMFFTPNARQSEIGHDGHPRKGEFLPPIPLPRRMFVGREVEFRRLLRVGEHASKRSEIVSISQKLGRSGPLVFLTVRHTIEVQGSPALIEHQHVVYRDAPTGVVAGGDAPAPAPLKPAWSESVAMDPVLVFRYSAVTWNGHRIHYDADYARNKEGYPGCVMNGALTVHLLIDAALRHAPGATLTGLKARLVKPLFVGETLILAGQEPGSGRLEAWAADAHGALAGSVELLLAQD